MPSAHEEMREGGRRSSEKTGGSVTKHRHARQTDRTQTDAHARRVRRLKSPPGTDRVTNRETRMQHDESATLAETEVESILDSDRRGKRERDCNRGTESGRTVSTGTYIDRCLVLSCARKTEERKRCARSRPLPSIRPLPPPPLHGSKPVRPSASQTVSQGGTDLLFVQHFHFQPQL